MLKIIGSIFIITATTGIGFSKSKELQNHLNTLEELKKLFCLLRSELQYTHAPFVEVFSKISTKTSTPYKEWLSSLSQRLMNKTRGTFWEIWCLSITEDLQKSYLKEDELEELKNVSAKHSEHLLRIRTHVKGFELLVSFSSLAN